LVQCQSVGQGLSALQYLSRYLYRGVISNKNILSDDGEYVILQYKDSQTNTLKTRRLSGENFIALVLQHVLPKGFRRSRDYGFLHGNAKRLLKIIQWFLQVILPDKIGRVRPQYICKKCQSKMTVTGFSRNRLASG